MPGSSGAVGYENDIRPLFRLQDRNAMAFAFDLHVYEDVAEHAGAILASVENGSMPCDAPWPRDRVDLFARWVREGKAR